MRTLLFHILVLIVLAACGKKEEAARVNTPAPRFSEPSGSATELEGSWSHCGGVDGLDGVTRLAFRGNQVNPSFTFHSNPGCTEPVLHVSGLGVFKLGDEVDEPEGSREVDISLHSLFLTPLSSSMVKQLNDDQSCGRSDWELGVEKNVSGTTCETSTFKDIMQDKFDVYKIVEAELFLGDSGKKGDPNDGTSADRRPTKLSDKPLRKI